MDEAEMAREGCGRPHQLGLTRHRELLMAIMGGINHCTPSSTHLYPNLGGYSGKKGFIQARNNLGIRLNSCYFLASSLTVFFIMCAECMGCQIPIFIFCYESFKSSSKILFTPQPSGYSRKSDPFTKCCI